VALFYSKYVLLEQKIDPNIGFQEKRQFFHRKLAFLYSKYCYFVQKTDHNIGFQEKRRFCSRKLGKIAEISDHNIDPLTLLPGRWARSSHSVSSRRRRHVGLPDMTCIRTRRPGNNRSSRYQSVALSAMQWPLTSQSHDSVSQREQLKN
jgi:hypothetical protein